MKSRALVLSCLSLSLATHAATTILDFEGETKVWPAMATSGGEGTTAITNAFAVDGKRSFCFRVEPEKLKYGYVCCTIAFDKKRVDTSREYDRILVNVANLGPDKDKFTLKMRDFAFTGKGDVNLPGWGRGQIVIPIGRSDEADKGEVGKIDLVGSAAAVDVCAFFDSVQLMEKGDEVPPVPACTDEELRIIAVERAAYDRRKAEEARAAEAARVANQHAFRKALADAGAAAGICAGGMLVGKATGMDRLMPRDTDVSLAKVADRVSIRLARGEMENAQIFVMPAGDEGLRDVSVRVKGDLVSGAATMPAGAVACSVVGYTLSTNRLMYKQAYCEPSAVEGGYVRKVRKAKKGWYPDPVLPMVKSVDVAPLDVQSFWISVSCPRDQKAGTYAGALVVSAAGAKDATVPFEVRVNDFTLPVRSVLPLALTFSPMVWTAKSAQSPEVFAAMTAARTNRQSVVNLWGRHKDEWSDFLMDHLVTPDNIYLGAHGLPFKDKFRQYRDEGRLGNFCIGSCGAPASTNEPDMASWRAKVFPRIRKCYNDAKELGILDRAYIYGFDEWVPKRFPLMAAAVGEVKREFPDIPLMTTCVDVECGTGSSPLGQVDWFCLLTSKPYYYSNSVARAQARKEGRKVWWYVACGEHAPRANLLVENPLSDARQLFGAQSWAYKTDGFLYYEMTIWNTVHGIDPAKGPFTSWPANTWSPIPDAWYSGDGTWVYATIDGRPVSTIRFENLRDGLEDYAYMKILSDELARRSGAGDAWADRARKVLAVPKSVMKDIYDFNSAPAAIYAWRDEAADLIEKARISR